jgi:hypothetical protein
MFVSLFLYINNYDFDYCNFNNNNNNNFNNNNNNNFNNNNRSIDEKYHRVYVWDEVARKNGKQKLPFRLPG